MVRNRKTGYVAKEMRRRRIEDRHNAVARIIMIAQSIALVVVFEVTMVALMLM